MTLGQKNCIEIHFMQEFSWSSQNGVHVVVHEYAIVSITETLTSNNKEVKIQLCILG